MGLKAFSLPLLMLALITGCDDAESIQPEIHLIPEGYIGQVTLYFDKSEGAPKKLEGNARVYEIPSNGKLRTRFATNMGISPPGSLRFYYVNSKGTRTMIPLQRDKNLLPNTIVVRGAYLFNKEAHYFIDRLDRVDSYKNPAIDEDERN